MYNVSYVSIFNIIFFRYSFGAAYEQELCNYIHQYLELGTDDRLCYVGPQRGSLVPLLTEHFCLTEPVTEVEPGHIVCNESGTMKRGIATRIPNVGAEEYFRREAEKVSSGKSSPPFDKVLLRDVVPYLQDSRETFDNIMKTMGIGGRLLIIHRAAPANTLPLFADARIRMEQLDRSYSEIVADLQTNKRRLDVQWQIHCLEVYMEKKRWLAMVRDRYPPQLEIFSDYDVRAGVRELTEGTFKYTGAHVEFTDRLLFACATHSLFDSYPAIQRFGASAVRPFPGMDDLQYQMELTPATKKKYGFKTK